MSTSHMELESSFGASPSTPRTTDCGGDCSPERTPGPGEGSPVAMSTHDECEEEYSIEMDSIVAEAEERSTRRAEAIRGVLAQLRVNPGCASMPDELPPLPLTAPRSTERQKMRRDNANLDEEMQEDEEPLPQPRAHPPPAPVPMPFSGGLGHHVSAVNEGGEHLQRQELQHKAAAATGCDEQRQQPHHHEIKRQAAATTGGGEQRQELRHQAASATANERTALQLSPSPPTSIVAEQRKLVQHCGALEAQLERSQQDLDRTMGSLESEHVAAQGAHDALFKAEAEISYSEGMAARKEAELRTELLSMRVEHQRERDRLRSEARRMQTSLKDMQCRVKAEVQARAVAMEQVEALKEQLAVARTDMQKRGREGQDARAAFATLEKRLEQFTELFRWVGERCTETLGEDAAHELHNGHSSESIDGLRRILSRTLTLLQRRAVCDTDGEKENKGNAIRTPRPKKASAAALEAAQRLASVQGELLNYEVQNEELISRQRSFQERLSESEEALQREHSRSGISPGLRTEGRGRLRAAEDGQKRLQKQLAAVQDELQWQYARHEEEHEKTRSRLSALQRAKEAGERYIEGEEDAWINAQRQERELHSECVRMRGEIHDAETTAREACADAAEARAASQMAVTTKRRLEADLEELQAASLSTTSGSVTQDHSVEAQLQAQARLETEAALEAQRLTKAQARLEIAAAQSLRAELEILRDEASVADRRSQELQQVLREEASGAGRRSQELEEELEFFKRRIATDERSAGEWHSAVEKARRDDAMLRRALDEQVQASQSMELQFKAAMESQQAQQAKIDDAKRVMVNNALEQQEHALKHEIACAEASVNARHEEAVRELQRCADEHQEQMLQLDYANKSLSFYQQQSNMLETELQQQQKDLAVQQQDLAVQEQQICDFGRAELTAMTAQQEANLQAHVDAVSSERTEAVVAKAVASARAGHSEELAHLRGSHAAAVLTLHGEYSAEIAAMLHSEQTRRDELAASRVATSFAEAAGEESLLIEAEKVRAAQRSVKDEAATLRTKLRRELRKELFDGWRSELWAETYSNARQEVVEEIRGDPRNTLRRELADQLRAELRDEMRSEINASSSSVAKGSPARVNGSPPSSVKLRYNGSHGKGSPARVNGSRGTPSGIGAGASPSSIGACSTAGSSPECASSALLLAAESSSSCWPDAAEHAFKDLGASATFSTPRQAPDMMRVSTLAEETAFSRRPHGVASAPASRQSSNGLLDFREQVRPTGVFRQWTDPSQAPSWPSSNKLEDAVQLPQQPNGLEMTFGALPPPPELSPSGSSAHFLKASSSLPKPPTQLPNASSVTSFQDQASAVLDMVTRSRAPFRATGFQRQGHGQGLDPSFGNLPPWPSVGASLGA